MVNDYNNVVQIEDKNVNHRLKNFYVLYVRIKYICGIFLEDRFYENKNAKITKY